MPTWLGDFQNPEVAPALADYAAAFAERFPWVRFYTPVNEMYVCARMSALDGLWNEQLRDEGAFVTAAFNLARASVAMSDAILARSAGRRLHQQREQRILPALLPRPGDPAIADFENERRFLPLDLLLCARRSASRCATYLARAGHAGGRISSGSCASATCRAASILGVDYYEWNEKLIDREAEARRSASCSAGT